MEQGIGSGLCRQEGCGHMGVGVGTTCSWGVAQKAARQADELLHKGLARICWITRLVCSTSWHEQHAPSTTFVCKDVPGAHGKVMEDASICQWTAQCACTCKADPSRHIASACCYLHSISSGMQKVLCCACVAHKTPTSCLCMFWGTSCW